ncbi:MAG: hypothetical protein PHF86_14530, partial [Candidatus Nanoarchaeia archaeon]|nr:hypothetical protein [Candidatus Nanoarchaeia archaeon]
MIKQIEISIIQLYNFLKLYPEYKNQIKVETRLGFYPIEECDITAYNSEVMEIITNSNKVLKCSPNHQISILKNNGLYEWISINKIQINDIILTKNGNEKIIKLKKTNEIENLYDLQVQSIHEYYTNNIVSHNSTILDALSFCLYGQPYRKIKIKDLINRKNKKNLKVTCKFKVNNYETYQIIRTLNPDSIEILKNGESLDLLSSKKLNQDEIDKIIGINYQLFRLVIALAVNYNKPFLALSAMEKRDIIEQIFNIKIFGLMLKGIKKKTVDEKTKNEINEKTISLL